MERFACHRLFSLIAALGLLLAFEHIAYADCLAVANEEADRFAGGHVVLESGQLTEGTKISKLQGHTCSAGAACAVMYFETGTKKPAAAPVPTPQGYTAPAGWSAVGGDPSEKTCLSTMYKWVFTKGVASGAGAGAGGSGGQDKPPAPPPAKARFLSATSLKEAHQAFLDTRTEVATTPGLIGTAQVDLSSAATETLQILGQIVVDRASSKAYQMLQSKLESLLACSEATTSFPATCAAVASIRIEDLAMAPTVLFNALGKDLLNYVGRTWPGPKSQTLAEGVFASAIVPLVAKPDVAQDATIRAIIDSASSYVAGLKDVTNLPPSQAAVVLGTLAYAKCVALSDGAQKTLVTCDVSAIVDQLAGDDTKLATAKPAARNLAGRLLSIASAGSTDKQRVRVAVDTFFDTSCMLELADPAPTLACADIDSITDLKKPSLAANDIAFMDAFVDAAMATDAGRMVVVAAKYVDLLEAEQVAALTEQKQKDDAKKVAEKKKSALRLLAGLLDYAATFAVSPSSPTPQDQASMHDQRTKILESLTSDMTNRTGRDGDTIVSLGGALRLAGGIRVGVNASGNAFYGPVSLPLGLAVTHIAERGTDCGIHAQLDAFDLGNYVSYDAGPKVKTPEVGDAVSPSISVGAACGRTLPWVLSGTVGYTPQFQIDPNNSKRGAWNLGLTVGVYVPLLDLN